jgi:hypothetical protein
MEAAASTGLSADGDIEHPDAPSPGAGQTAMFNAWGDAQECARCGGRMVRTGACYTCGDCGNYTGCGLCLDDIET